MSEAEASERPEPVAEPVVLAAPDEAYVREAVASGRFRSREEVVSEALVRLRYAEERLERLREDVRRGWTPAPVAR